MVRYALVAGRLMQEIKALWLEHAPSSTNNNSVLALNIRGLFSRHTKLMGTSHWEK